MHRCAITRLTARTCANYCAVALMALAVGVLTIQTAFAPRIVPLMTADFEESEQEEDIETGEFDAQEASLDVRNIATPRTRRANAQPLGQLIASGVRLRAHLAARSPMGAELLHRNGTAGPLRC